MSPTPTDDPFAKYGGKAVQTAPSGDPFAKYGGSEVKKNPSPTESSTGSVDFTHGYKPSPADIKAKQSNDNLEASFDKSKGSPFAPGSFEETIKERNEKNRDAPTGGAKYDPTLEKIDEQLHQKRLKELATDKGSYKNLPSFIANTIGSAEDDLMAGAVGLIRNSGLQKKELKKPLYDKTGKELPVADMDFMGKFIQSQNRDKAKLDQSVQDNPLPNTGVGKMTSGFVDMAPHILATALLPEVEEGEAETAVAKLKKLLFNNFTKEQAVTGGLSGANEAQQKGDDVATGSLKGATKSAKNAAVMNLMGGVAEGVSKPIFESFEKVGLVNPETGGLTKAGIKAVAATGMGAALPFVSAAGTSVSDKLMGAKDDPNLWANARNESASNVGMFGAFSLLDLIHGYGQDSKAKTDLNDLKSTNIMSGFKNLMETDIGGIKSAHSAVQSVGDTYAEAIKMADDASKETDPEKKQQKIMASQALAKASNVKAFTEKILSDKDGLVNSIQNSDLPDAAKNSIIDKVNAVHKELDPVEQKKTQLENQIKELQDNPGETLSDQKLNKLKSNELNKQLDEIVNEQFKQQQHEKGNNEKSSQENGEEGRSQENGQQGDEKVDAQENDVKAGGEEPPVISVKEVMDKPITYHGEPAEIVQDGQTLVAKIKGSNREYELGNVDEVRDKSIKELGIEHQNSVVSTDDEGDINVRGKKLKNNYSDPLQAINHDEDGNVVSVNLETPDGKKRTFRGDVAEDIAYQIHLKEINKNNETKQQFEQFAESDKPTKSEIVAGENDVAAKKSTDKDNAPVSRKPAIRKPKVKEEPFVEKTVKPKLGKLPLQEHSDTNKALTEDYGINIKDLKDANDQERNQSSEATTTANVDAKAVQQPQNDGAGNAGKDRPGKSPERSERPAKKAGFKKPDKPTEVEPKSPSAKTAGDPLRDFANKIRDGKISKLGGYRSGIFSTVWDKMLEDFAQDLEDGAKLIDAIDKGLKYIKSTDWYKALADKSKFDQDYKDHMSKEYEKTGAQSQDEGGKEVKKTILTKRAYEGSVSDEVKEYLEDKGLKRTSFSQEERSRQGTAFINEFGEDAAFRAVEAGDINGGLASSILVQLHIRNSDAIEGTPEGSDERDQLAKKDADIIALMEKNGYFAGEYIGQLAHEYQNKDLNFASIKRQVEKLTKKPLTKEQETKIKATVAENEKLKAKLKEAESKLIEATDKELNEPQKPTAEPKDKAAKRAADKIREDGKKERPPIFLSAASQAWTEAVEKVAKTVEKGGKLDDGIEAGLNHIHNTDWYDGLSQEKKQEADDAFRDHHDKTSSANVRRLEKELANLKEGIEKGVNEKREPTKKELDLKEKIQQEKNRIRLNNLQKEFIGKKDNKFTREQARGIWGHMKENYLNNGTSYQDALSKTAQDLGLSWRQVSEAVVTPKLKRVSDEMWKRNSDLARNRSAIKTWIGQQESSAPVRAWKKISGLFRGVATFGHGHIFLGTHAGMTFFNPSTWRKTIPAFFRGFKLAYGSEASYEKSMQELKNSDNYLIAQRAGLKNDPDRINVEEYQKSQQYLGRLGHVGERGFNTIKVLRQHLFDYHFDRLSAAERDDPEVAKSIAQIVNLSTGATNLKLPSWVNEVSFAGGMEAARWEKLLRSPARAAETLAKAIRGNATPAEKVFAKVWARRVGEQVATYTTAIVVNAYVNNYLHPDDQKKLFDPTDPNWWKFKFGKTTIDPTSGMRSTFSFLYELAKTPFNTKAENYGKSGLKAVVDNSEGYARGKLAPLYGTIADFVDKKDFTGNAMPRIGNIYKPDKPGKGHHKLTWVEYAESKLPLPVAEAFGVFYQSALDHGANKKHLDAVMDGIISGVISGGTGFRVGEDKGKMKKPGIQLLKK